MERSMNSVEYSTNSTERMRIPFFIAAAAIAFSFFISQLLATLGLVLPWWLPSVDTMVLYGGFYWLFDTKIWKMKWSRTLRITRVPDLSGEWAGHVRPTTTQ